MPEYTDQEIEMLARFAWDAEHSSREWHEATSVERQNGRAAVNSALIDDLTMRAAARLMRDASATRVDLNIEKTGEIRLTTGALDVLLREAREQGAASTAIDRDRLAWLEKWYPGQEEQNRHLHQSIAKQKAKHAAALIHARNQGAAEMREMAALLAEDADVSIPMRSLMAKHIRSLAVTKGEKQ